MNRIPTSCAKIVSAHSEAVLATALTVQFTTLASLMLSLTRKGLLTPEEMSAFATRTADMCSQNLRKQPEGDIRKIIDGALHLYVDELLKLAELGIPGVLGGAN